MERLDKLNKLVAVYDQFHEAIAQLDDLSAKRLVEHWAGIRQQYVEPFCTTRTAFAAGLEQGLREIPMLLQSMHSGARKGAGKALAMAIATHYPDFHVKDAERLAKIKARGFISSENDFHLVRHHADLLEVEPGQGKDLRLLNDLLNSFEGRST